MVGTGRKLLQALIALQLSLTIFSVLALPDACLCGKACRSFLHDEVEKEKRGAYHERCRKGECESCKIETVIAFDAGELYTRDYRQEHKLTLDSVIVSINSLYDNPVVARLNEVNSPRKGHPTSYYLQNCSLLF